MRQGPDLVGLLRSCGACRDLAFGRRLHAQIVASEYWPSTFLANHTVLMYGRCESVEEACAVFDAIPDRDRFSWNIMLEVFARNGHFWQAKSLFDGMPNRDIVSWNVMIKASAISDCLAAGRVFDRMPAHSVNSWNTVISTYARDGHMLQAALSYEKMLSYTNETLVASTSMIIGYGSCDRAVDAKRVFDSMRRKDVIAWSALLAASGTTIFSWSSRVFDSMPQWNLVCCTTMIQILARGERLDRAREIFDWLPEKNTIAWTSMIQAYLNCRQYQQAVLLYDSILLISSLALHGFVEESITIFERCPISRDPRLWEAILAANSQAGRLDDAEAIFARMPQHSAMACTTLLSAYAQSGHTENANPIFEGMEHRDAIAFNAMIQSQNLQRARRIFQAMPAWDACSWTSMLQSYVRAGLMLEARQIFDTMPERDIIAYTGVLQGYVNAGEIELARNTFERMPDHDVVSSTSMISAFGQRRKNLTEAREIFESVQEKDSSCWSAIVFAYARHGCLEDAKSLFESAGGSSTGNLVLCNEMISLYSRAGHVQRTLQLFSSMHQRDVVSWNSILGGFCESDLLVQAKSVFELMPRRSDVSHTIMISVYSQACNIEEAECVFKSIPDHRSNAIASTAMMAALAHNGDLHRAMEVFRDISKPTFVSWITMITAYAHHGVVVEALELFWRMPVRNSNCWNATIAALSHNGCSKEAVKLYKMFQLEGLEPNEITVLSVLTACSRSGLLREAFQCFMSMMDDCLVKVVSVEHYSCMVDVLSRTGRLKEAKDLIEHMPFVPSSSAWNSLLAACATQNDKFVALEAGQNAMEMPTFRACSSPYAVLANIHCMEVDQT